MLDDDLYFEDFTVGYVLESPSRTITEAEIIVFGKKFAPLPYHTDPEAAKDTMFGGVVAAGLHTASIAFGLFVESGVFNACGMGSPGHDSLRWLKPVRPGDTLHVRAEVTDALPPRKQGGRNLIKIRMEAINQNDETVMVMHTLHYVKSRP